MVLAVTNIRGKISKYVTNRSTTTVIGVIGFPCVTLGSRLCEEGEDISAVG
jgi:hypothetical protein